MTLPALLKHTGSKRKLAPLIATHIPPKLDTYTEPFCGSASVAFYLMSEKRDIRTYVLSDKNPYVVSVLHSIGTSTHVIDTYRKLHKDFNAYGDSVEHRKKVYNETRSEFNRTRDPGFYFFLTRTCANGLIRFNSKGGFNSPCHFSRPGIGPDKVEEIISFYKSLLGNNDVNFSVKSYSEYDASQGFFFLDPPYPKSGSLYQGGFNTTDFENWVKRVNSYCLTYKSTSSFSDGPAEKYVLNSGNSSFSRLFTGEKNRSVEEILWVKTC